MEHRTALRSKAIATRSLECDLLHTSLNYIVRSILPEQPWRRTEKREQSVKAHICQSNRLGYYLIKRTADASQMAAEIKTLFIRNHIYLHTDSEKDVQVLRERFLEWKYRNACKLNGKYWVSLSRVLYCFSRKFQYSTRLVFKKMKPPYASLLHGLRH